MKPNFALDLAHDGIGLMHRSSSGWSLVGEVKLDAPDLSENLAVLRQTATQLESRGITTKLVLPNSQVLYTTIATPGPDDSDRAVQIRAGLEGLTPYAVADLAFDWRSDGDKAHVAVVARETLDEAEAFATEHRFNPVCFVARPGKSPFRGEAFFGPSRAAAALLGSEDEIEPDRTPVPRRKKLAGQAATAEPPGGAAAPDGGAAQAPDAGSPADAPGSNRPDLPALDPFPPTPENGTRAATVPSGPQTPAIPKAPPLAAPAVPAQDEPDTDPDTGPEPDMPLPTFSSRRDTGQDAGGAPRLDGVAPRIAVAEAGAVPQDSKPKTSPLVAPPRIHVPVTAPHVAADESAGDDEAAAPGRRNTDAIASGLRAAARGAARGARSAASAASNARAKVRARKQTGEPARPTEAQIRARRDDPTVQQEADKLTVFGARRSQDVGGKPQFLGLMLTLALLLFFAIVAVWSMFFLSDGTSSVFPQSPVVETAEPTPEAVAPEPDPEPVPESSTETELAADLPATTPGPEIAPAPSALDEPTPEELDELAAEDAMPAMDMAEAPAEPAEETLPDLAEETGTPPEFPAIAAPVTREAAEARYAATGIWQVSPDRLSDLEGDRIDDIYIASIDPGTASHDALAPPALDTIRGDTRPLVPVAPPPPGTRFEFDERGLVRATPDGALTPQGILVYSRPPHPAPRPRPGEVRLPAQETGAGGIEIPRIRPRPRPGSLIEDSERNQNNGLTNAQLAERRPRPRPERPEASLDDSDEAGVEVAGMGRRPSQRPSGFDKIVARARDNADNSDGSVVVAAAAAGPRIPTRANVATQATVKNAINLKRMNLIGIYGSAASRRALVRMPSGRYVKVSVGDRLDGGKVVSIADDRLVYVKKGKSHTLKVLPLG